MIMAVLVWVLLAAAAALFGAELIGWGARLQIFILRRASVALPRQYAERYMEEWRAELNELPQAPITRLIWVSSIWLHRGAVARALGTHGLRPFARTVKGILDRTIAGLVLFLLAPTLLMLAVMVCLTSRGPALFRHTRVGIDDKTFTIIKFRTMHARADRPQVTPLGRVLRRYALDELPQLVNVLRGEMSLVGPRPPLPSEVAGHTDESRGRLSIKPGITGLWELRNSDQRYAEDWTPALDVMIILRTIRALIRWHDPR